MGLAEWLAIIGVILSLIVLAILFYLHHVLIRDTEKDQERAEKCREATEHLLSIEAAGREAKREGSREKCEQVNRDIEAWNAKYALECATGKTVPKLDCE